VVSREDRRLMAARLPSREGTVGVDDNIVNTSGNT